jgi:pyruvate/2-oxoglutarate dehydrogenase complex dihydrolipoamide acyltransferase (E2) component
VDGELRPRRILPLSLSFDHRATDGAESARFLGDIIDRLEHPGRLIL